VLAGLLQGWGEGQGRGRGGSMEVDRRKECVWGGKGTKRATAICAEVRKRKHPAERCEISPCTVPH